MASAESSSGGRCQETLEEYVANNRDILVNILRHGSDNFARGCALAVLTEVGDVENIERVIDVLEEEI